MDDQPPPPPPLDPEDLPPPPPQRDAETDAAVRAPRKRRGLLRTVVLGITLGAAAGATVLVLGVLGYVWTVLLHPGEAFSRAHLQRVVAQESVVTYQDGTTPVGVFFEDQHRRYVAFDALPRAYVMSLVAIEDRRFWHHQGFDFKAVGRATRDNLRAGRIVSGGSTLSQQAAKNLFGRPDRSFSSKGGELLDALRLEAHYSKPEVLEFYANQFHVTGNGRGIGIAARHFFDKDPSELTVLECAYLAGMVKAPTKMDPYFGGDEVWRDGAVARAHLRTEVVLRELLAQPVAELAGPPPSGQPGTKRAFDARLKEAVAVRLEAQRLLEEGFELPFKRGPFRFDRRAVLDEVAHRLNEAPFDVVLPGGVEDPRNAGIRVVTTLDVDVQREATYALWHHLTESGARLEGLGAADYPVLDHPGPKFDPDFPPKVHEFRVAKVVAHVVRGGKGELDIDLGGHPCRIDRAAVVRAGVAAHQATVGDANAKAPTAAVDAFLEAIDDGSVLMVSVREVPKKGPALCDLELRPELQGAVTVVRNGQVLAMVGGNDDRNYNRAQAPRQLGSTMKPLVFHAAMWLGWSPDDSLDNTRNVFPYSGTFYYPTPDHAPQDRVSMAWAGTRSENLASVWLLYHLLDSVDDARLATLVQATDLGRIEGESDAAYRTRLSALGVLASRDRVPEAAFQRAKRDLLLQLPNTEHPDDAVALRSLTYGWGYGAERQRVSGDAVRLRALAQAWQQVQANVDPCMAQHALFRRQGDVDGLSVPLLSFRHHEDGRVDVACGPAPSGYGPFATVAADTASEGAGTARPWFRIVRQPEEFLIHGLHLVTIRRLAAAEGTLLQQLDAQLANDAATPAWLDPTWLYHHGDFRTLLAMRTVAGFASAYGVKTELRPVLSLPLGASEMTIEEATALYEGLATGKVYRTLGVQGPTVLVREIHAADGRLLYRADVQEHTVVHEKVAAMTADVMRNVVRHGTGQRAAQAIVVDGHPVPVGGKTGTTNGYRNAAFVGFVPTGATGGFDAKGGYFIGATVGYDDNRPMVNGRIRLQGASGALPVFIGTAQGLRPLLTAPSGVPLEAGTPWPLVHPEGLHPTLVDTTAGLPSAEGPATVLVAGSARVAQQQHRRAARPDGSSGRALWDRLFKQLEGQ